MDGQEINTPMLNRKSPYFYFDKPIFGMDIGHTSLKVMQSTFGDPKNTSKKPRIVGYGYTSFGKEAISDGVIVKPEIIAEAAYKMFSGKNLVGDITSNRAAIAIPAYRIFTRYLSLPKLKNNELKDAIKLEVDQYLPGNSSDQYIDYEIFNSDREHTEVFFVAVPKVIVDSYLNLADILNIEAILIEPTLSSSARLFSFDVNNNEPSVIIDFGSQSSDISIFVDRILATGTVSSGGDSFTEKISKTLNVNLAEAKIIKNKYGLGVSKKQKEIVTTLEPILLEIIKELKRVIRYYDEQFGANNKPIKQIITFGGGANMPGLNEYLTLNLRMPVRNSDPWQYFDFNKIDAPALEDKPMYATVAGLSIINPKRIFKNA